MVKRTRIKVCGITDRADLVHAVAAGVDGLGFIFAEKSPRRIEPEKARELIKSVPPFVDAVGVFVNEDPDVVTDIIKYCGLTMVQLHGQENIDYCQLMPVRVLKSFAVSSDTDGAEMAAYSGVAAGYLLDTYHKAMAGGTGQTFDWNLIDGLQIPGPVFLAGGLGPENVGAAISAVRPFAVDINSGVETAPGCKDHAKITALVEAVRRVDLPA
ncbi:MAG: phosphoribosylanthranilate isomerase [Desulfobulbaceae bacterium]|nr:phosphoribosylanthranilate isomerase [Desulfobulbaceae bacterium]